MELVPMVYEHAAQLIGETPWRVSRSEELLYAAHAEAYRQYRHAPVVVGIDIYNVEPEAYGARVEEPAGTGVPYIALPPCPTLTDILRLSPLDPRSQGRMPLLLAAGRRLAQEFPDADIRLPVSGPVSIAGNLLGLEALLCEMLDDPEVAAQAFHHLVRGQLRWCREIIRQGLGIVVFDSAASPPMVSPSLFREIVFPVLQEMMEELRRLAGVKAPLIIGGDTAAIAGMLAAVATDYLICPAETDQQAFLTALASYPDIRVRVNMRAGVAASSDWQMVCREIDRLHSLVSSRELVCLGTSIIPFGTPPERIRQACNYAQRLL